MNDRHGELSEHRQAEADTTRLRRRSNPRWLTVKALTTTTALLAIAAYSLLYAFDAAFLRALGTTPEEVGLTKPVFLIRAGVYGTIFLTLFMLVFLYLMTGVVMFARLVVRLVVRDLWPFLKDLRAAVKALLSPFPFLAAAAATSWTWIKEHVWPQSEVWRTRRELLLFSALLAIPTTAIWCFAAPDVFLGSQDQAVAAIIAFLILCSGLWLLARYRYVASVVVAVLVFFGGLLSIVDNWGFQEGQSVRTHMESKPLLVYVGLQADLVTATWPDQPQAAAKEGTRFVLLGHGDGVFLLWNGTHLLRIPTREVNLETE